jgi:hypothetical protein
MPTPASPNAISVKNVENTLNEGLSTNYPDAVAKFTFNDSLVRLLAGRPTNNSIISMSDMRNKAGPAASGSLINQVCSGSTLVQTLADGKYGSTTNNIANSPSCGFNYNYTIPANTNNFDWRKAIVDAGWNGTQAVNATLTITTGIYVTSISTGSYALYISPSFPAGSSLTLINNGYIIGKGGAGGKGGGTPSSRLIPGEAGTAGGPALYVGYYTSITNNGLIGGGGGGGGGGGPG